MLLNTLQSRLTEKNRELQLTLMAEQDSLVKTKTYLKEQQDALKQRRVALRQAHKDWSSGLKSSKKAKGTASVRTFSEHVRLHARTISIESCCGR